MTIRQEKRISMVRSFCKSGEYTYVLSQSTIVSEDFGAAAVYGISIIGKRQTIHIEDVSDDFRSVRHLFNLIVADQLYPEHLHDVVEDFLSGVYPKVIPLKAGCEHPYTA